MACVPSEKARWGKDGPGGRKLPLRVSRDRMAAAACPLDIDSRDKGPFSRRAIVLTGRMVKILRSAI